MSVNEKVIAADRRAIWNVISDAKSYERWVVGAKKVRATEGNWPQPGARFHHSLGVGPLVFRDSTKVLDAEPLSRLELRAGVRPIGTALVRFNLEPVPQGTKVIMTETPAQGILGRLSNVLTHLVLHGRNAETLNRLDIEVHKVSATSGDG